MSLILSFPISCLNLNYLCKPRRAANYEAKFWSRILVQQSSVILRKLHKFEKKSATLYDVIYSVIHISKNFAAFSEYMHFMLNLLRYIESNNQIKDRYLNFD